MGAAQSGHSTLGIPKSVGKEFINADPGGKLPQHKDRRATMSNDVENPKPASGPMSTGGPNGTSESLPKTVEPFSEVKDARPKDCAMSMDEIKAMGKRIGKY
jgi:hypothetical protein